jgi:hypothetical protein
MNDRCPETIVKFDHYTSCFTRHVAKVEDLIDPKERNLNIIIAILEREKEKDPSIVGIQYTLRFHIDSKQINTADPDRYFVIEQQYFHDVWSLDCTYDRYLPKAIDDMINNTSDRIKHIPIDSNQKELMYPRMKSIVMTAYVEYLEITGNYYDKEFYEKTFSKPITRKTYYDRLTEIGKLNNDVSIKG